MQKDSNGDDFRVNEIYDMVDTNAPQGDELATMKVRYLGFGITEARANPHFIGPGLGDIYKNKFVFQQVDDPGGVKFPISKYSNENGELMFNRHYPGSIRGGRKSTRKTRRNRKRPTRRFRI